MKRQITVGILKARSQKPGARSQKHNILTIFFNFIKSKISTHEEIF
jgi:hypothetical protein